MLDNDPTIPADPRHHTTTRWKVTSAGREAKVKKALAGISDRFHVEVEHNEDLKVKGNVVDHEYEIERDGKKIAEVSKKWLRARDTYGVEVNDPADVVLVLSVTVALRVHGTTELDTAAGRVGRHQRGHRSTRRRPGRSRRAKGSRQGPASMCGIAHS